MPQIDFAELVEPRDAARTVVAYALSIHGGERAHLVNELAKAVIEVASNEMAASYADSASAPRPTADMVRAFAWTKLAPQMFGSALLQDIVSVIQEMSFELVVREIRSVSASPIFNVNNR